MTITIDDIRTFYEAGGRVADVVADVRKRIAEWADPALFIGDLAADLDDRAVELDAIGDCDDLPLFGIPFVVKDNIDVAGMPTTAACPAFGRVAATNATAVQRLLDAGAIVVGKTNLDQFATGLVGTRSPYGTPRNALDRRVVPGGSSSGSAAAVAAGLVPFSLGTDTAGSGRVPAAMNQVIGMKPTRGLVSTAGVVPACASLDCVSVFATKVADASRVFAVLGADATDDPRARADRIQLPPVRTDRLRVGVVAERALGDVDPAIVAGHRRVVGILASLGADIDEVSFEPFAATGALLYGGPFVAERTSAVGAFVADHPHEVIEPTRSIVLGGRSYSAVEAHEAWNDIHRLRDRVARLWLDHDVLVLPTVPSVPTLAAVDADPIGVNSTLGRFSTFANLLDLAAVTLPDPVRPSPGLGVTLFGPAGADHRLAAAAAAIGGELFPPARPDWYDSGWVSKGWLDLVVVGAHLDGEPLNHELTDPGGQFVEATTTASAYRLWALPDGRRPALERVAHGGAAIEVEVWSLPTTAVGEFLRGVGPPLALGTIELADGRPCVGFVGTADGFVGAVDVTATGGWRSWQEVGHNP